MKKRRDHTDEFKRDAVQLMVNRGTRSVEQVAKSVGVSPSLLHRWYLQYGEAVAAGRSQEAAQASEDVAALRRRVRQLEQENALLKTPRPSSRRRTCDGVSVHPRGEGGIFGGVCLPGSRRITERLLPMAQGASIESLSQRRAIGSQDSGHPYRTQGPIR